MITASSTFLQALSDSRSFKINIDCTLADSTSLTFTNSNIRMDSLSFDKAVSDDSAFGIGSFIVGKLAFTLNNITGLYTDYDFDGAVLTFSLSNNLSGTLYPLDTLYPSESLYPGYVASENVQIGVYTVIDTEYGGAWISLTAYDNAVKFQIPLSDVGATFPVTASSLVSDICTATGVTCSSVPSELSAITIPEIEDAITPNCLQAIAWCAMLGGYNATIDASGNLVFQWYNTTTLASVRSDIETNGWDSADLSSIYEIDAITSASVCYNDVSVTGVSLTYSDEDGDEITVTSGTDSYMISVSENPFVDADNADAVLTNLATALVGMCFRPFDVSAFGNPLFEPGDIVYFADRKSNYYLSVLTSISFAVGSGMTVSCGAEAPERNAVTSYSATTRKVQQVKAIANRAAKIAGTTNQYFWHTESLYYFLTSDTTVNTDCTYYELSDSTYTAVTPVGTENPSEEGWYKLFDDTGAHISEVTQETFIEDPDNGGGNLLARSNGIAIRDGLTELATFSADGVVVGQEDSIHSTMESDGFGVSYGTDKLFDVSTNGYLTSVYMGGSTLASGVKYTNSQVIQILAFLGSGCTVSGTSIYDPNGEDTGYTLEYDSSSLLYYVLDPSGDQFTSASYGGIYYDADGDYYEPNVRLEPLAEVATSQTIINMGDVGISAYNGILDLDAETLKVARKYSDGVISGDIQISDDAISFGSYSDGTRQFENTLSMSSDLQRGTLMFASNAPYGGQIGIENYDNAGGTLYTGMEDISGIGDGTVTGAIASLVPSISYVMSDNVSVSDSTHTTVSSVSLLTGTYILVGTVRFNANGTGHRNLHFASSGDSAEIDRFATSSSPGSSSGATILQVTYPVTITTDGTTLYLVTYQTSGSTLTARLPGIRVIALDGGGIYGSE